jgi:hypothetical protein
VNGSFIEAPCSLSTSNVSDFDTHSATITLSFGQGAGDPRLARPSRSQ